jgi:hypothetical protein
MSEPLEGYKANYETLLRAANNGDLAMLDVFDTRLGRPQAALVILFEDEDGMINIVPIAMMNEANPYDYLLAADPDSPTGYGSPIVIDGEEKPPAAPQLSAGN